MNEKDFVFWLKGYTDNLRGVIPTRQQWDKMRHELALVFNKVTPYRPTETKVTPESLAASFNVNAERRYCSSVSPTNPVLDVQIPVSC